MEKSTEVKRASIKENTKMRLWAMAAGRCEICNRVLYKDLMYGMENNHAEMAHIYAVSEGGPRHDGRLTREERDDVGNLMLLCDEHHKLIDGNPEWFTVDFLRRMKARHEMKVHMATEVKDNSSCQMLTYFSNFDEIKTHSDSNSLLRTVVCDGMYPGTDDSVNLSEGAKMVYEATKEVFEEKARDLEKRFRNVNVTKKEAIAVFALAPQPLLFKLGTLLSDQSDVHVFQFNRDTGDWKWPKDDSSTVDFKVSVTKKNSKSKVALVIDLSAEIKDERVVAVLGEDCSIYHLSVDNPNRYLVKNKKIQEAFVEVFRDVMETMRNDFPDADVIRIFPAMPQSLAVRAGMDYMPKSDLPVLIYEQTGVEEGFIETIKIGGKE